MVGVRTDVARGRYAAKYAHMVSDEDAETGGWYTMFDDNQAKARTALALALDGYRPSILSADPPFETVSVGAG